MKQWFVYIRASGRNGTLYTGMTTSLTTRGDQHALEAIPSFTSKYHVHDLVYYEVLDSLEAARTRERNIKAWKRAWKIRLVEEMNPQWEDLSPTLVD